ncbi:hypothetical protein F3Y22_tig00110480pilonHSYRG00041 [Hibiscus syriacus]|uniref:PHD-type domain-containing protein n=1 Tax=Hibiscus syriacus TaxID=106335 RepID=A0A6A3AE72_HIBSY|nr:uncharacterized protein LOC120128444 isoform X5 [Hibiscus syriacus]XP_039002056.1 uncharacterized protein LOC120128444 isoform X5 [Hibiscus syriacus]XP_039002057.1 uncharacterized protein LOC120128444 isoform X5 [Hibiscus syriacus]KAE8702871.1 hypothetical protein F3Y22_tig00110480pilonHSYRG00041 [Hibiscus syriacus]
MEERLRSGEHSGAVKNRSHSGCLIVRKKGDGSGGAGSIYEPKTYKRRSRMSMSDSGSSDELVMPPRRRAGPETIQVCNGLAAYEESEIGRKRNREERVRPTDKGLFGWNGEDLSESKKSRLEVFDFDEYDGLEEDMIMRRSRFGYGGEEVGRRRLSGSMPAVGRMSIEREYESGPRRYAFPEKKKKKKNLYLDKTEGMSRGDHDDRNMFRKDRDGTLMHYPLLRERYMADSDEPIRVQGKNGVLKVMVNKKKKVGEPLKNCDHLEVEEGRSGSRIDDRVRRNMHACSSVYSDTEVLEKPVSFGRKEKKKMNLLKTPTTTKNMISDSNSEDSDTSLKLRRKDKETSNRKKKVSNKEEKDQVEQLQPTRIKEGKNRRGCGTEKQKLRERIREMLQEAGWTIDYRPRRNRDYLDAVYINPAGTAYWSIIKAYDALQKQLDKDNVRKPSGDGPAFTPLSNEVLSQLTRKTGKKTKKNRKDESGSEDAQEPVSRKSSSTRHEDESMDGLSHEEKLSSFMKGKSMKHRMNDNHAFSGYAKGQKSLQVHDSYEKPSSISNSRHIHGRKSRKLGRCTLLVRGSNVGASSEGDDFVPYYGKRTLLAWLIDSEVVQLSQKVQYMNRRRTKVMLEGWITGDGIHCGCCSKILTVSKFEIHAGSKLRQPFQNIYLDTGVSLLQCEIDAWNRQVESEQIGFHSVDVNGDDPNDDTCGICGDGGDLICCDSCPSTFHQSCLNIEFLPAGDWHCPNCICKFCGNGSGIAQEDDVTDCVLLTCNLCEKRYHESCTKVTDEIHIDSNGLVLPFCGITCRGLFEHLQKYLGVKHEVGGGFSWSLIRRTDADSDIFARGLPQRVECNSKLAVALSVMDECFLPIVDRRSGINLVNNVVYNCGSNFNRLNYSGFYTAILERGDEIISAASIRFHGIQLAEMPFIGTRHTYRHQGMFRRLFCAIESVLCSLKVHKLVIPAIAEVTPTWTGVFGFTALKESVKQEMRSMNMLVFLGIDMLQKFLPKLENTTSDTGAKQTEPITNEQITAEVANGSKPGSSSGNETDGDLNHSGRINGETRVTDSDSQCPNVSVNDTCGTRGSSDASLEPNDETTLANYQTGDTMNVSRAGIKYDANPSPSHDAHEVQNKAGLDYPAED